MADRRAVAVRRLRSELTRLAVGGPIADGDDGHQLDVWVHGVVAEASRERGRQRFEASRMARVIYLAGRARARANSVGLCSTAILIAERVGGSVRATVAKRVHG